MSLINRIEISNFLDSSQTGDKNIADWRPDFLGFIIDAGGQNTLVSMDNGTGKTSICEAVIAVLSRNRELVGRTKERMAPKAKNCYSHIRIEIVVQADPSQDLYVNMGGVVPGEKHVLGIYGNEGAKSDVVFYWYYGALEDCPVVLRDGLAVSIVPDEQFKKKLQELTSRSDKGIFHADSDKWRSTIAQFFEPPIIKMLAKFQIEGAGDNNSNMFAVKYVPNESYDATFFYTYIIPELLVNPAGHAAEDEEEDSFERTVVNTTMLVLQSQHNMQQLERDCQTLEKKVNALRKISNKIEEIKEAEAELQNSTASFAKNMATVTELVINKPLPGLPPSVLPDNKLETEIAGSGFMVTQGHELYIMDKGLSIILDEPAEAINQKANRKNFASINCQISEVIEIPCDNARLESRASKGGPSNKLYSCAEAVKILEHSSKFKDGFTKETAITALRGAFAWAETNIHRQRVAHLTKEIAMYDQRLVEIKKDLISVNETIVDCENALKSISDAKIQYDRMKNPDYDFTAEELKSPIATKTALDAANAKLTDRDRELNTAQAVLVQQQKEYNFCTELYGTDDLRMVMQQIDQAMQSAKSKLEDLEQEKNEISIQLSDIQKSITDCSIALNKNEHELSNLERLAIAAREYRNVFGDEHPEGLLQNVENEYFSAQNAKSTLEKQQSALAERFKSVLSFREKYGDISPETWLMERKNKLEHAKEQQRIKTEEKKDKDRRRRDLDKFNIAASQLYSEGLALLTGHESLHESIAKFSLSEDRRRIVTTLFSNFLFAPVFETESEAAQAAELLSIKHIEIPVFLKNELREFCENENNHITDKNSFAYGYFVGIRTRPVDCLLDPTLVQREKDELDKFLTALTEEINAYDRDIKLYSMDSEDALIAQNAKAAINNKIEEQLNAIGISLDRAVSELNKASNRFNARSVIRDMGAFMSSGGYEAIDRKKTIIQTQKEELERLRAEEVSLYEQDSTIEAMVAEARDAFLEAVKKAENKARLEQAVQFIENDGVNKLGEIERERNSIIVRQTLIYMKLRATDFELAQKYVDANASGEISAIEENLQQALAKMETLQAESDQVSKHKDICTQRKEKEHDLARDLDERVRAIIFKFKEMKKACNDLNKNVQIEPVIFDIDTFSEAEALQTVMQPSPDGVDEIWHSAYAALAGHIKTISFVADVSNINAIADRVFRSKSALSKMIDEAINSKDVTFNEEECKMLTIGNNDFTYIKRLYDGLQNNYKDQQAKCDLASAASKGREDELIAVLHNYTSPLYTLYEEFVKVVRPKKGDAHHRGEAGFEITMRSTTSIEEAKERIQELIDSIKKKYMALSYNGKADINLFRVSQDDMGQMINHVRNDFFRRMFIEPKIKVYFPSFKKGGMFQLDLSRQNKGGLSGGQRTALTLLWIVKFAEFSMVRERMQMTSQAGLKNKKAPFKERMFIIDGIFSSLSNRDYINDALSSLASMRGKFQIIGLAHQISYAISTDIFKRYFISKRILPLDHHDKNNKSGFVLLQDGFDKKPIIVNPTDFGRDEGQIIGIGIHTEKILRGVRGQRNN